MLGDTVNTASRVESSVSKPGMIVSGEYTCQAVEDQFECRSLGTATLKGKEKDVAVYEVVGPLKPGDASTARGQTLEEA